MKHSHLKQNAVQLLQKQQFSRALDECSKYCKKVKSDPEGLMLLGSIYGALGQIDNSINAFKKAIRLRSDVPQIYFNLGVALQNSGDMVSAAENLQKAIKLNPEFFEAHFNLGDVYQKNNQPNESLASYEAATRINPEYPPLYLNMGNVLKEQDRLDEAVERYLKAIALAPNYVDAHINLGILYSKKKMYDQAEKSFRDAITIKPDHAMAYLQLGICFHSKGNLDEAHKHLIKSIKIDPNIALSHNNLGILLKDMGETDASMKSFEKAIELTPDYVIAYQGLAAILCDIGATDKAAETLLRALEFNPQNADFYSDLATTLGIQGHHIKALKYREKAIELSPDDTKLHLNFATGLAVVNRYDEAISVFEKASGPTAAYDTKARATAGIASIYERRKKFDESYSLIQPYIENSDDSGKIHPKIASVAGSLSRKLKMEKQAIKIMELALDTAEPCSDSNIELHFQLGKTYDGIKSYDKAFEHYGKGNKCFRIKGGDLISRYSIEKDKTDFDNMKKVFNKDFFSTTPGSVCKSKKPVFVVGMPRSGTTLTESIISSHPMTCGGGEMHDISEIAKAIQAETGRKFPEGMPEATGELLQKLAQHYLSRLDLKSSTAAKIVDKMPHNFRLLGLISLLFPEAKIIHIQRQPIDNCLSIYFQHFNIGHTYASDLMQLGQYYRLYQDLMDHWNQVLPVPILNLKYDELVVNQETMTRKMIDFCDLDWDDQCLSFHTSERDVATPSYDQVSQPMYSKSSGRWKDYQHHIAKLVQTLGENGALDHFESLKPIFISQNKD